MKKKIVLKRLSASDLTLFEYHYRNTSGTKQKAFNLDRAVFIDKLYPSLPETAPVGTGRVPLDLSIYGPGLSSLHNLQRKILKQQKNWRLNGELIYNPPEDEKRYAPLEKGDFAIIDFSGETEPSAARMYLIARNAPNDAQLYEALDKRYSNQLSARLSMVEIDPDEIARIIDESELAEGHPVADLLDVDALEDAVQGGQLGTQRLKTRRKARGVSREEFERSKRNAEKTGRLGEEILNGHLEEMRDSDKITDFSWVSDSNAIAPYDFTITEADFSERNVDAKSTSGDFNNPIHVSIAELMEMANSEKSYDIYRLYSVRESYARLRIAADVKSFAIKVLDELDNLPEGVSVDSISISPKTLHFDDEIEIDFT